MNKLFWACFFCCLGFQSLAQNLKTQVLVMGNSEAATAAAFQAALSGVKTTLVLGAEQYHFPSGFTGTSNGIEGTLLQRLHKDYPGKEADWTTEEIGKTLNHWSDSVSNLTVLKGIKWTKVDKSGSGWQMRLSDGRTIKSGVLILGVQENLGTLYNYEDYESSTPITYDNTKYRTSLAGFFEGLSPRIVTLENVLSAVHDNLILLNSKQTNMTIGQAAGIVAAYGQFFGVKASQTKLKGAQGEALAYRRELLPVSDITSDHKNWRAIQNILVTGILKLTDLDKGAYFSPVREVTMSEIEEPTKAYFYKAQLWFEDHAGQDLTIEKAIHLITYTRNKSFENTLAEVEKKWKNAYHFEIEFDKARLITRKEFAAIAMDYFRLDQVNVDAQGVVLR